MLLVSLLGVRHIYLFVPAYSLDLVVPLKQQVPAGNLAH